MLSIYRQIKQLLTQANMAEGEASAIAFMLIEAVTGLSRTEALTAAAADAPTSHLLSLARKVAEGVPVQYALGHASFCGMKFHVEPGVLIPRPETEELVDWAASTLPTTAGPSPSILDIGTGSGCIAIALFRQIPQSRVTACDISADALRIAQQNAEALEAKIDFLQLDILNETPRGKYDCIISNPPYIPETEAAEMDWNVLGHEPHQALFVPDQSPLLFYEAIASKATSLLTPGGHLFFEINRRFGPHIQSLLRRLGFRHIQLRQDQFGNDRMVHALSPA